MKALTAKDAKGGFGRLIDLARAKPVAVAKHGRPVIVVMGRGGVRAAEGARRAGNSSGARKKSEGVTMPYEGAA
jgi:prevent-host-death family protein